MKKNKRGIGENLVGICKMRGLILIIVGLTFLTKPLGAEVRYDCSPEDVGDSLHDANCEIPTSRLGMELTTAQLTSNGHFEVFSNTPTVDPIEGGTDQDALFAADALECAYERYIHPVFSRPPHPLL